jgi:hypothetical protein
MSQSDDVRAYLTAKYQKAGLIDKDGNKTTTDPVEFDPYNYPSDGLINYCAQCQADFDAARKTMAKAAKPIAEFEHSAACLWYDFFVRKVKLSYPNASIRRKN